MTVFAISLTDQLLVIFIKLVLKKASYIFWFIDSFRINNITSNLLRPESLNAMKGHDDRPP